MVHRICSDRILERGGNHQTLTYDESEERKHEEVVWMFLGQLEELDVNEARVRDWSSTNMGRKGKGRTVEVTEEDWEQIGEVVEMRLGDTLEESVRRAVDACVRIVGVQRPSDEEIKEAVEVVQGYRPATVNGETSKFKTKGNNSARYFGLLPEIDLYSSIRMELETVKAGTTVTDDQVLDNGLWMLDELKKGKRITGRPHVTIVHRNSLEGKATDEEEGKGAKQLWAACQALNALPKAPLFQARLGNLVWDEDVMALTVDDLELADVAEEEGEEHEHVQGLGRQFLDSLSEELRRVLHVTVGTREQSISAYEAKALVGSWRKGEKKEEIKSVVLESLSVRGRVKGLN